MTRASMLVAALCSLVPATAFAHPGHGHTDPDSWQHYLTEPVHVIPLALLAAIVIVAIMGLRARVRRGSASLRERR